ncbi:hypothetical protein AURDEDRAFT_161069 [Auricularia subglabra TFB-10046 SS5]|nr:hypothetical protein AURDEDRAFT_161069 [Auricularia subglabra TFB-10046 SS5]
MGCNPLLIGLVDMDGATAHFHYNLDFALPKAAIAPYDCCVSSDDFIPLVEGNRGALICAGRNISRPLKLPNYVRVDERPRVLGWPCGLALAGIAPLSALFVTPPGSSSPSLVYSFLQRMWLAWQFAQRFADLAPLLSHAHIHANSHWCQRFTAVANNLFDDSLPPNFAHSNLVVGLACSFLDTGGGDFPVLLANFASHSASLLERYSDSFFTFHPALTPCAQCSQVENLTVENEQDDDDDDDPLPRKRKNSSTTAPPDTNKMRKTDEKVPSSLSTRHSAPFGPASVQARSQNNAVRSAGAKKAGFATGSKPAKKTHPGDVEMDGGVEDQLFKPPSVIKPIAPVAGNDFPGPQSVPLPRSAAAAGTFDQYCRFSPIDPVDLTFKWNDAGMTVFNSLIDLKRNFVRVFGALRQSHASPGLLVPDFVAFQAWLEERDAERGHIEEVEEVEEIAGDGGAGPSRDSSVEEVSSKKGKVGGRNKL